MSQYQGLLIRDTLRDTGIVPSAEVPTYSPDIICYQDNTLTVADAVKTYGEYINMVFLQDYINNIYVRAKNTSTSVLTGKVKAFYAPLNLLYMPSHWNKLLLSNEQEEVELVVMDNNGTSVNVPPGAVACSKTAFGLTEVADPSAHHCMMGLATNADGTYIDLPASFSGDNALWLFLQNHPQIAYNNITIQKEFTHTVLKNVEIGNLDPATRDFVMNVTVMNGVGTLKNAELRLQSTDQDCPFSYKLIMDGKTTDYTFPTTSLCADFSGVMNFAVIMPDYENVNALLRVENYAVNKSGDIMIPNAMVTHSSKTVDPRELTLLGDFYLLLGNAGYAQTAPPVNSAAPKPRSLRLLTIYD